VVDIIYSVVYVFEKGRGLSVLVVSAGRSRVIIHMDLTSRRQSKDVRFFACRSLRSDGLHNIRIFEVERAHQDTLESVDLLTTAPHRSL